MGFARESAGLKRETGLRAQETAFRLPDWKIGGRVVKNLINRGGYKRVSRMLTSSFRGIWGRERRTGNSQMGVTFVYEFDVIHGLIG